MSVVPAKMHRVQEFVNIEHQLQIAGPAERQEFANVERQRQEAGPARVQEFVNIKHQLQMAGPAGITVQSNDEKKQKYENKKLTPGGIERMTSFYHRDNERQVHTSKSARTDFINTGLLHHICTGIEYYFANFWPPSSTPLYIREGRGCFLSIVKGILNFMMWFMTKHQES
ncbi:hypothetical protein R3P38DRAFT_2759448 [Favolaschia claudopus]|uniref:Uncharacterized protein n=1 Tax=Favolaschia claudopus TaxID=2862362 RepID=A0AAW0E015_9AGAR